MDYPNEPPRRPPLAEEPDGDGSDRPRAPRQSGQGSVLAAAMLAVGDIIEPEKTKVEIQQHDDDPEPDLPVTLDFGDLPPL